MKNLYLMGSGGSGKTAIALGLAQLFKTQGKKISYFKPIGSTSPLTNKPDEDAVLMKAVLSLPFSINEISPYEIGPMYMSKINPEKSEKNLIFDAYAKVAAEADITIIDGGFSLYAGASIGIDDISLARELEAPAVFVVKLRNNYSIDRAIHYNRHIKMAGVKLVGNIFNNIPRPLLDKTRGIFVPFLEKESFSSLGVIPEQPEISSPTVSEFVDTLGGELLTGNESSLGNLVEDVVVGSMTIESALSYLRRGLNKAVITGGDRSDIALTALATSTSVLILTGGLYPDVGVIARAQEQNVPVLLVHYDTYSTIEKLHEIGRRIRPQDSEAIRLSRENVSEHVNWQQLLSIIEE